MTREEAIKNIKEHCYFASLLPQAKEALDMAVKALEQTCGDTISRQAAILLADELKQDVPDDERLADMVMAHNEGILDYQSKLSLLPSVNPQYTEDEIQKMQDLEQAEIKKAYELGKVEGQNSEDAISRQAVLDLCDSKDPDYKVIHFKEDVECLPSVNPQAETTTVTIGRTKSETIMWYECYACGEPVDRKDCYCSMCGRKLIHEQ